MAENKKSFILYADLIHTVRKMPKDKAGELFLTILQYVNDENPNVEDILVDLVFEPIKHQLKRDLIKWSDFREKQSFNGAKGGRPKKDSGIIENPKNPTLLNESQKSLNVTVNDTVNVTVNATSDYYIVNGKIEKGNIVDWYLKNQQNIFEAELMKLNISSKSEKVIQSFRERFINGSSFNDYKHITNSFRKHIIEIEKKINPPKPKLVQ